MTQCELNELWKRHELEEGYYECLSDRGNIIVAFWDKSRKVFDTNEVALIIKKLNW